MQSIKDTIIHQLVESNKFLQEKVASLEKRVVQLEIDHQTSAQYNRQNNLLISGIPPEVKHENLEEIAVNILNKCNAPDIVNKRDFAACHRISEKSDDVVCRLINRKDVEAALNNRGKLNNLTDQVKGELALPPATSKIYLNVHLTPYNSKLAFYCRRLITNMSTKKGVIKILGHFGGPREHLTWKQISHLDDLHKLFPDIEDKIVYPQAGDVNDG